VPTESSNHREDEIFKTNEHVARETENSFRECQIPEESDNPSTSKADGLLYMSQ
jgi:hypothetical protein